MDPKTESFDAPLESGASPKSDDGTEPLPSASVPAEAVASPELSKEEQWELFEKELKESDWGHQPC